MRHQKRILCVHQGAELYGSDRSFLQCVSAIRKGWPAAHIRVVLAADGPLRPLLEEQADEVVIRSLGVLRLANPLQTLAKTTIAAPYFVGRAAADIRRCDLAYINTTVISDYMIAARGFAGKCVIHAREIPKPKAMPIIDRLVRWSGAGVVFNSKATAKAFSLAPTQKASVIYNGVAAVADPKRADLPDRYDRERPLRIALLGRVNDWKGQDLLIEALGRLDLDERRKVAVRIVGSAYLDRPEPIQALENLIAEHNLETVVTLEPFQDDTAEIFEWSDICAVPSRLPEPFGRVAIEAMANARPVLASAHGGPVEIVGDGASGWLFAPNDATALASAIREALSDPLIVAAKGKAALRRFEENFSEQILRNRLQETIREWVLPAEK